MTLKTKRCIPLAFTLIAFIAILAISIGSQPINTYVF